MCVCVCVCEDSRWELHCVHDLKVGHQNVSPWFGFTATYLNDNTIYHHGNLSNYWKIFLESAQENKVYLQTSLSPRPKTNPSADRFQYRTQVILEAIHAPDEVWERDYPSNMTWLLHLQSCSSHAQPQNWSGDTSLGTRPSHAM